MSSDCAASDGLDEFDHKIGDILDIKPPLNTELKGRYKKSFAYYSFRYRVPIILNSLLDSLNNDKQIESAKSAGDFKFVVDSIEKLKLQIVENANFELFAVNETDSVLWNDFLSNLQSDQASYFKASWLHAECYLYRKISSFFKATKSLKDYDYFQPQKCKALDVAANDIIGLLKCTKNAQKDIESFVQILKLNLWGNRCDLSITTGKEVKPVENLVEQIMSLNSKILADDSEKIWNSLKQCESKGQITVGIICDNAGFELFTDLLLASYLMQHQLAHKVTFHVKTIPWFISDTTAADVVKSLEYYQNHESVYLKEFGEQCQRYLTNGQFQVQPDDFWTSPYEYHKMPTVNPSLYEELKQSSLIVFKGDLNYRKLLGDFNWDFCEEFRKCLRGFQPTRLCALRTVKADLICGLKSGMSEELFKQNPEWMLTGEFAVIQYSE